MNWNKFLEALEKDPKNFAKAIIENLYPPKYVNERIRKFEWICHFCWKPRIDLCCRCHRNVCEDHHKKFIGKKTELEWYFCLDCLQNRGEEELLKQVKTEDEQFWLEDQEQVEVEA